MYIFVHKINREANQSVLLLSVTLLSFMLIFCFLSTRPSEKRLRIVMLIRYGTVTMFLNCLMTLTPGFGMYTDVVTNYKQYYSATVSSRQMFKWYPPDVE